MKNGPFGVSSYLGDSCASTETRVLRVELKLSKFVPEGETFRKEALMVSQGP